MPRRLVLAALAVLALAVGLFLLLREDDGDADADRPGALGGGGSARAGEGGRQVSAGTPRAPRRGGADADGVGGDGDGAAPRGPRTYGTDTGNLVRDHRSNVAEPVALPAPMPPAERTMSSQVTAAIAPRIAAAVRGCGAAVPADARGPAPVVHVTLVVDVVGEQISHADASAVTSDVTGPAADQLIACVRERASDLTVAAKGEPDRTGYVVQFPVSLR